MQTKLLNTETYLLLIDEEAEIKIGDIMYDNHLVGLCTCTDIKDSLLFSYTSSFLNAVKVIAYYPLTKEAKELDLPLLPPFEVTKSVEYLAEEKADEECQIDSSLDYTGFYKGFIEGYNAAQSKQFSLEDMRKAVRLTIQFMRDKYSQFRDCEEEIIQSLSTQQLPKEFIISDKFSTFEENIKHGEYKW